MENSCPQIAHCALFNDQLLKRQNSANVYKALYCNNPDKYPICKRYTVSKITGRCATYVLPNSSRSIEELLGKMINDGLIPEKDYDY